MAAVAATERNRNCLSITRCASAGGWAAKESGVTGTCSRAFGCVSNEGASGSARFSSGIATAELSRIRIATDTLALSIPHWTFATIELRRHVRLMHHRYARWSYFQKGNGIGFVQTGTGPKREQCGFCPNCLSGGFLFVGCRPRASRWTLDAVSQLTNINL